MTLEEIDQRLSVLEKQNISARLDWIEDGVKIKITEAFTKLNREKLVVEDFVRRANKIDHDMGTIVAFIETLGQLTYDLNVFEPSKEKEEKIINALKKELTHKTKRLEALEAKVKSILKD